MGMSHPRVKLARWQLALCNFWMPATYIAFLQPLGTAICFAAVLQEFPGVNFVGTFQRSNIREWRVSV